MERLIRLDREHFNIGKAVQLYIKDEPYIAISDSDKLVHFQILEKILKQNDIEFKTYLYDDWLYVPELKGKLYEAAGMSWYTLRKDSLVLHLTSQMYGIGPDKEHLEKIKKYIPDLILNIRSRKDMEFILS